MSGSCQTAKSEGKGHAGNRSGRQKVWLGEPTLLRVGPITPAHLQVRDVALYTQNQHTGALANTDRLGRDW